jgi:hypothetical protein
MHRHLHRPQQPLRITGGDGRPGPAHHIGHAEAVQGYLHGLLGAAGEQELLPAVAVALDRNVLIEAPLVEQHPGEVVGREPGEGFFGFGDRGQAGAVDPGDALLEIAEKVGIDPISEEKGDVCE